MAVEPVQGENGGHPEFQAHVRNYSGFTRMVKVSAIAAFIIAMIVVWLISS